MTADAFRFLGSKETGRVRRADMATDCHRRPLGCSSDPWFRAWSAKSLQDSVWMCHSPTLKDEGGPCFCTSGWATNSHQGGKRGGQNLILVLSPFIFALRPSPGSVQGLFLAFCCSNTPESAWQESTLIL